VKKTLFLFAVSISLSVQAQQFSFQMYFKDAIGNRDTLTLGYDTAATKFIDAAFGEVNIIGVPLDSVFDVRVTDELLNRFQGGVGTFHTKKQIIHYDCDTPLYNRQSIDIFAKHWPVTATWDSTLFNNVCLKKSYFTSCPDGCYCGSSDLYDAVLRLEDSVTFTTNTFGNWNWVQYNGYVNGLQDTIPVFSQTFADSLMALPGGLKKLESSRQIKVFPNPTNNSISVSFDQSFGLLTPICLYNIYGQLVLSTSQRENIDVTSLPVGLYLIKVADNYGRTQTVKFQKI
jgi:hypothetical protein